MVDGVPLAWLRVTLLHQDPDVAESGRTVLHSVRAPFELRPLTTEFRQQPGENVIGIRSPHVNVVQAEQIWILDYFDARAPWVFHECELKEPWHFTHWRRDLDTRRL